MRRGRFRNDGIEKGFATDGYRNRVVYGFSVFSYGHFSAFEDND